MLNDFLFLILDDRATKSRVRGLTTIKTYRSYEINIAKKIKKIKNKNASDSQLIGIPVLRIYKDVIP